MHRHHILIASLMLAGLVGLPGCANKDLKEGRALIEQGRTDEGLQVLRAGVDKEPRNPEIKAYYHLQRERQTDQLLRQADLEIAAGRFDDAAATLARIVRIHPENPRARLLVDNLENRRKQHEALKEAETASREGRLGDAQQLTREVLAQSPSDNTALALQSELQEQQLSQEVRMPALDERFDKAITLEFRDAPVRSAFDMISRQSGINFVFDKDVRLDTRATLFARDTPITEAIDLILATGQLAKKVINDNTLLIYPNQPQKQKDYQPLAVKSFYLGNADARSTLNMLRTLIKTRDAYIDEKLNLLVIRDTPEAIAVAERLIAQQDLAEAEVMLEVEVLEIQRNRLLDLGAQYPNQFTLLNTETLKSVTTGVGGNTVENEYRSISSIPMGVDRLRHITGKDIGINTPLVNLKKEIGDVNLLANPRIRVKNREKAKIHIGDKVPIITSNATSTGVVSESVSYLDVGLKLDVEPQVMAQTDVQIKVNLEVSNIVREIKSNSGTLTYQIGTRNAGTTLRLHDGETQILAGLISESDRKSASRVPGLGDLPIIGRLFANQRDENSKSEIVLLITPHVLRTAAPPHPTSTYFPVGTETRIGEGISLKLSNLARLPAPKPLPPQPAAAPLPAPVVVVVPQAAPALPAMPVMPVIPVAPVQPAPAVAPTPAPQTAPAQEEYPPVDGEAIPAPATLQPAAASAPTQPAPALTEPAPQATAPSASPMPAAPEPAPQDSTPDWEIVPIVPGSAAAEEIYGPGGIAPQPAPAVPEPAPATGASIQPYSPSGGEVQPYAAEQPGGADIPPYEPAPNADEPVTPLTPPPQLPEGFEVPKGAVFSPNTDQPVPSPYETGEKKPPTETEPTVIGGFKSGEAPAAPPPATDAPQP